MIHSHSVKERQQLRSGCSRVLRPVLTVGVLAFLLQGWDCGRGKSDCVLDLPAGKIAWSEHAAAAQNTKGGTLYFSPTAIVCKSGKGKVQLRPDAGKFRIQGSCPDVQKTSALFTASLDTWCKQAEKDKVAFLNWDGKQLYVEQSRVDVQAPAAGVPLAPVAAFAAAPSVPTTSQAYSFPSPNAEIFFHVEMSGSRPAGAQSSWLESGPYTEQATQIILPMAVDGKQRIALPRTVLGSFIALPASAAAGAGASQAAAPHEEGMYVRMPRSALIGSGLSKQTHGSGRSATVSSWPAAIRNGLSATLGGLTGGVHSVMRNSRVSRAFPGLVNGMRRLMSPGAHFDVDRVDCRFPLKGTVPAVYGPLNVYRSMPKKPDNEQSESYMTMDRSGLEVLWTTTLLTPLAGFVPMSELPQTTLATPEIANFIYNNAIRKRFREMVSDELSLLQQKTQKTAKDTEDIDFLQDVHSYALPRPDTTAPGTILAEAVCRFLDWTVRRHGFVPIEPAHL